MEHLRNKKGLDEDGYADPGQLDISPVGSSGSSSVLSPNAPSESLSAEKVDAPCIRRADVKYPDVAPPKTEMHLHGFWGKTSGGHPIWRLYLPPLKYKELPANIKFKDFHWMGQILPNGTVFDGWKPDGTPVFQPPETLINLEDKRDPKVAEELRN
jgi:hypothetical protein